MPDAYERHLERETDEHDRVLAAWWCEGQTSIEDQDDPDDEDLDSAPEAVTGGHVCRVVTPEDLESDPDDARDLEIDDDLLDRIESGEFDEDNLDDSEFDHTESERIEDVDVSDNYL